MSNEIKPEIIKEISTSCIDSFRLTKSKTFGELTSIKKFPIMNQNNLNPLFEFHIDLDIIINEKTYYVELSKKELDKIEDASLSSCLKSLEEICSREVLNMDTLLNISFEEDSQNRFDDTLTIRKSFTRISRFDFNNPLNTLDKKFQETEANKISFASPNLEDSRSNEKIRLNELIINNKSHNPEDIVQITPLKYLNNIEENDEISTFAYKKSKNRFKRNSKLIEIDGFDENRKIFNYKEKLGIYDTSTIFFLAFKEKNNILFISNDNGRIFVFRFNSNSEVTGTGVGLLCDFDCATKMKLKKQTAIQVTSLNYSHDLLITGLSNGFIALWEEKQNDYELNKKFEIKEKEKILYAAIIKKNEKKTQLIYSDVSGNCNIIEESGFFTKKINVKYSLFSGNRTTQVTNIKFHTKKNQEPSFKHKNTFYFILIEDTYSNQKSNSNQKVKGFYLQVKNIKNKQDYLSLQKKDKIDFTFFIDKHNRFQLIISYRDKIELFILDESLQKFLQRGLFEVKEEISKIDYLVNSYIFLLTKTSIKIFDTSKIFDKNEIFRIKEIELKKKLINPENENSSLKEISISKVFSNKSSIYIFSKDMILRYTLKTWEKYFNDLAEAFQWEALFYLSNFVLQEGYDTPLSESSSEFLEKKEDLKNDFLRGFTGYIAKNKNESSKLLELLIESSIKLNKLNFLITECYKLITNLLPSFFYNLEDIIIKGEFKSITNIPVKLIEKIIEHYVKENKKLILSRLLTHFNYNALNVKKICKMIENHDLLNTSIYISINSTEGDFFSPIESIYKSFLKKKENVNYVTFITLHEKTLYNDEMLSSKQYFGHKLLWYCDLCLNGYIYPDKKKMKEAQHEEITLKIFVFLTIIAKEILTFDSFSFFEVFTRLLIEERLLYIILNQSLFKTIITKEFVDKYQNKFSPEDFTLSSVINIISATCDNIDDNFYILKDFYTFLGKVCCKNEKVGENSRFKIEKYLLLKAIDFLIEYPKTQTSCLDTFCCHIRNATNYDRISAETSDLVLSLLKYISDDLTREEIEQYLSKTLKINSYNKVQIYLLEKIKNYVSCLEMYISEMKKIEEKRNISLNNTNNLIIQNNFSRADLINYIKTTLDSLREQNDVENYNTFLNCIFNHLVDITQSSDELKDIINIYCNAQQKKNLIYQLNNYQDLQLEYINYFLSKNNEDCEDEFEETSSSSSRDIETSDSLYENDDLHTLKIKILCSRGQYDLVYEYVTKNLNTHNDKVNKILLKNKVFDGAVFVYKTLGAYKEGLTIAIQEIEKNYKNICENLLSSKFKEKKVNAQIEKHHRFIDLASDICMTVSDESNIENYWIELLEVLYKIKKDFTKYMPNTSNENYYFFTKIFNIISTDIENILAKMCNYVRIQVILNIVNKNCKEADFKEFRRIIMGMIYSLTQMQIIYGIVKKMKTRETGKAILMLLFKIKKCKILPANGHLKCSGCNGIMDDDTIIVFWCRHFYHKRCCYSNKQNENICFICWKKDNRREIKTEIPFLTKGQIIFSVDRSEEIENYSKKLKDNQESNKNIIFEKEIKEKEIRRKKRIKLLRDKTKKYNDCFENLNIF